MFVDAFVGAVASTHYQRSGGFPAQAVVMRELDIIPLCLWSTDANVGLK
jgi:hypothetical protein